MYRAVLDNHFLFVVVGMVSRERGQSVFTIILIKRTLTEHTTYGLYPRHDRRAILWTLHGLDRLDAELLRYVLAAEFSRSGYIMHR